MKLFVDIFSICCLCIELFCLIKCIKKKYKLKSIITIAMCCVLQLLVILI